ncbi:MAG: hypothetical protein HY355_06870 [Armatimonadetes bacterium]|nr:hypothetical protein [Armatimonadota bacterium]
MMGCRKTASALRPVAVAGAIIAALLLNPHVAVADIRVTIDACKSVRRLATPAGTDLLTTQCGRRFSPRDPYIAIVTRIKDVTQPQGIEAIVQILDPSQAVVEGYRLGLTAEPDSGGEIWDVAILPIAASARDLALQLTDFRADIVQVQSGRPLRERLGTWTVRVTVNRQLYPFTFTLEGN